MMVRFRPYLHAVALGLVLIVAVVLRTYHLSSVPPGLYPDEAMYGNNALETAATGAYKVFYPENGGREGLFIWVEAIALQLAGVHEPWVLHLVSALFGILTVLGMYVLGRVGWNRHAGLLSAALLAVSFWHVLFSRIGFRAITMPFFIVWSFALLLYALRHLAHRTDTHGTRLAYVWCGAAGLVYGLGWYTYIAYRASILAYLAVWLYAIVHARTSSEQRRRVMRGFVVSTCTALLIAAPLLIHFVRTPADFFGRSAQVSVLDHSTSLVGSTATIARNILLTIGSLVYHGDGNQRHNIAGAPLLPFSVFVLVLVGCVVIVRRRSRDDALPIILIGSLLVAGAAPAILSNEGVPHALRSLALVIPLMLLGGIGATLLYDALNRRARARGTRYYLAPLCILLAGGILFADTVHRYFVVWGTAQATRDAFAQNYVDIGRQVNAIADGVHPTYVVVNASGTDVRGVAVPAQTVMFITDTFREDERVRRNIHYVASATEIPSGTPASHIFFLQQQ